jgi:hypothetical protein
VLEFSGFSKGSTAMSKRKFLTPAQKNNVMAELLQEHIELKKELGEP